MEAPTSEVLIQWGGGRVGARAYSRTPLRELDSDSPASLCPSQGQGAGPESPLPLGLGHLLLPPPTRGQLVGTGPGIVSLLL